MTLPSTPLKRLVLVQPPQTGRFGGISGGLIALKTYIGNSDPALDVHLLDLSSIGDGDISGRVAACLSDAEGPILFGVTTTTATYRGALEVATTVKSLSRESVVIFGGAHASVQAEVVIEHHSVVDGVISGEGEIALLALLRDYPDLSNVPNLCYRSGNAIQKNLPAPLLEQHELDRLRLSLDDLRVMAVYGDSYGVTYISARGCPLKCSFCAVANKRIRCKSVSAVIDDMRVIGRDFGCRKIAVEDNFFAHSPARTFELCSALEELQKEFPFSWSAQTRVESMRRSDIVSAISRAGCGLLNVGVESVVPEQLLALGKTPDPETYLKILLEESAPRLLDTEISMLVNLQLAVPGDNAAQRRFTIDYLRRLGGVALAREKTVLIFPQLHVIFPGTQHHEEAAAAGRFGTAGRDVFENYTTWEATEKTLRSRVGEHFALGTGGIPVGILSREKMRQGIFETEEGSLGGLVDHLKAIETIPGISVFSCGGYGAEEEGKQFSHA